MTTEIVIDMSRQQKIQQYAAKPGSYSMRGHGQEGQCMTPLLAAEWLKMRKRWLPRVLTLILLTLVALAFLDMDTNLSNLILPRAWLAALYFASTFSLVLWPILGGSWAGNEYGWGTVGLILTRRPNRVQWLLSAVIILMLMASLVVLATLIVGTIAGIIIALVTSHSVFLTTGLQPAYGLILLKSVGATWYVIAFYTLFAYAAGSISRSAAVGVGVGIGGTLAQLIVAGILEGLGGTWREIALHFPYAYSSALIGRLAASGATSGAVRITSGTPSAGASVLGMALYLALVLGLTLYVVKSRDVTS
jgi:hypothetical protein